MPTQTNRFDAGYVPGHEPPVLGGRAIPPHMLKTEELRRERLQRLQARNRLARKGHAVRVVAGYVEHIEGAR